MQLVIRALGLEKSFRGTQAVAGIDLAVAPGERVALLGPNGAGKTTTLLMLLGVITPDRGSIELLGHLLPRARSEAMQTIGFAAGLPPAALAHEGARGAEALRRPLRHRRHRHTASSDGLERFGIAAPRRGEGRGAVVRAAHARRAS